MPLTELPHQATGRIIDISPCPLKRRLLDLGAVPGTEIEHIMTSAWGATHCYRIRGALIAIRSEDAAQIQIEYNGVGGD